MESILHSLQMTDLALGSEVQQRWVLRQQVNARLLQHLDQTEHLPGFTGQHGFIGVRQGHRTATDTIPSPLDPGVVSQEDSQAEADSEHNKEVKRITEYLESLDI